MNDEDFLRALEACELPEEEFGHRGHVRAAYLCLRRADFSSALERVRRAIRRYAAHLGKPQRYHETMTVAYVSLIQQRMFEHGHQNGWTAFSRLNPELLDKKLLEKFYSPDQLSSDLARQVFVLPAERAAT